MLAAAVHGGTVLNEYLHIISDPAHVMAEVTFVLLIDGLLLGIAVPFIKRAIARHDRAAHGASQKEHA